MLLASFRTPITTNSDFYFDAPVRKNSSYIHETDYQVPTFVPSEVDQSAMGNICVGFYVRQDLWTKTAKMKGTSTLKGPLLLSFIVTEVQHCRVH